MGAEFDLICLTRSVLFLSQLDEARTIEDMRLTSFRLHALKGDMKDLWPVRVSANWRIIFSFTDGDADDVELVDYH